MEDIERLVEQLETISPDVKKMLEPIKKFPPKIQELALVKLYLHIKDSEINKQITEQVEACR